jgi:hypothetical protein
MSYDDCTKVSRFDVVAEQPMYDNYKPYFLLIETTRSPVCQVTARDPGFVGKPFWHSKCVVTFQPYVTEGVAGFMIANTAETDIDDAT